MGQKSWTGASGGVWGVAGNWSAPGAPGTGDDAVLTGPAGATSLLVTGSGSSASLTLLGNDTLSGTFGTGLLAVGTAGAQGSLSLAAGSTVNAQSATLLYGPLTANGAGTRLVVMGALTLGGQRTTTLPVGSTVNATGGAVIRAGSVVLAPISSGYGDTIYVDATSSLEVGTAETAAPGTVTIDAGQSLSGTGTLNASAGVANAGTILAQGGALVVQGTVSGAGQLQIGAGATLFLAGAGAPTLQPVSFTGAGGTLEVLTVTYFNGTSIASALSAQGLISGFVPGDTLFYAGPAAITAAVFTPGSGGVGTLGLFSGTRPAGTLSLAGSFSGTTFQVSPNGTAGTNITLAPTPAPGGGTAPAGTAGPDAYLWTASGGGAWATAGNWRDTTLGAGPAAVAPGVRNSVTLAGPAGNAYQTVIGPGNSADLTAVGNTAILGTFNTGALAVGTASAAGGLSLGSGASLGATAATIVNGALQAAGTGTTLTVSGSLTLGGSRTGTLTYGPNLLTAAAGAAVQVGALSMLQATTGGADTVAVDSFSSLEVGTAGHVQAGTITVDAGRVLAGSGTLNAASGVVDGGVILAQGGTLVVRSAVTGSGALQIGANATLSLAGTDQPSTTSIGFVGAGGTLDLVTASFIANGALVSAPSAQGTISGFAVGDRINYSGNPAGNGGAVSAATYRAGPDGFGTLTLNAGATVVGALTLAGSYSGLTFRVAPGVGGSADITVAVPPPPVTDPLFDAAYYLANNADVAAAGVDPYQHFLQYGWREGRNPSALFNTRYYLAQNPDVAAAGFDPLLHFETNGWMEGRDPSVAFSVSRYLAANPDVARAGMDPLVHYVTNGRAEGRAAYAATPHPMGPQDPAIDAAYVYAQRPDVAAAGLDATSWFNTVGWQQGVNPDPDFDTQYYLRQNPDVQRAGVNPLTHYKTNGWMEGRNPSLLFSVSGYLTANPDVRQAGFDPLLHYLTNGRAEGRAAFLAGTRAPADPLVDADFYDRQLGATLIPTGPAAQQQAAASYDATGWSRGLNPDAWFDTTYYLSHNADVAAAHVNPLLHYETFGWHEGRDPSARFSTNRYLAANPDVRNAGFDPLMHYVTNGQAEGRAIYAAA